MHQGELRFELAESIHFHLTSDSAVVYDERLMSIKDAGNDYTNAMRYRDLAESTLFDLNVYFSDWICGPLGYKRPSDITRQLLNLAISYSVPSI